MKQKKQIKRNAGAHLVVTSLSLRLRKFCKNEDGVITVFGIFIFLIMVLIGGIGIDIMRSEMKRTRLQATLDNAVLAAAAVQKNTETKAILRDYLDKSGTLTHLNNITIEEQQGIRRISASSKAKLQTQLMHFAGVKVLKTNAHSTVSNQVRKIKVSLVLDLSGFNGK